MEQLLNKLTEIRYERNDVAFDRNRFRVRGDTVEIFPVYANDRAIRVEFFGDEIDAMGLFDPDTQRRIENLGAAEILPAAEVLPQFTPGGYGGLLDGLDRLISQAKGARHWCRRWRRTGSGCRPARPSRPWTATSL